MADERVYRALVVLLHAVFAVLRVREGLRVMRSGGKVFDSAADIEREGRWNSRAGSAMDVVMPASVLAYAFYPGWVARLSLPLPAWLRVGGAALALASLAYLALVHRALGRHWSASLRLREVHRLVTDGPYARVRHPMYAALFAYMAGLSLAASNWVVLVPRAVQTARLYARIPSEERMMAERFGEEYGAYAARSGRLLPRRRRGI
ncbi:MAG TPA: isoprenylcysteine carboxylmethyltransferase family protein [Pyrinomonadaceae bacterium]|nr:isoprenylcysteine carboxylmethyltransferase family protein [Pyrinomonadaceae bacterium]